MNDFFTGEDHLPKEKKFSGLVIPESIWLNEKLRLNEKCLLSLIHGLDGDKGCFATNEYLASKIGISERQTQRIIAHLIELRYVRDGGIINNRRILNSLLKRTELVSFEI